MYQTVTEDCIAELVGTFYGKVREDELLGPVFAAAIGDNWALHLEKMNAFWASVLLAARAYKGSPMIAHLQLPRLTRRHFERWLQLWREAAAALCSPAVAGVFVQRAETMAERLLFAIGSYYDAAHPEPAGAPRRN